MAMLLPSFGWMLLLMLGPSLAAAGSAAVDALRQQQQQPVPLLARNVGAPPSHDWDAAIAWANDPLITPLLTVLKDWKVPAATLAYLLNPSRDAIPHSSPSPGRSPQLWFAAGFGMPFNAPMRVASVSKPLVEAIWMNEPGLVNYTSQSFFDLWTARVGALPEPLDARVKQITVSQLLEHTSGFSNANIGYDPAFQGKSVSQQIGTILKSTNLATDPGTTYSYSNFGYMILARLAQAITRRSWLSLNQRRFPAGAPVFEASDSTPAAATAVSAAEPSLYWIQAPDGPFKAKFMAGNGNLVSNAVTMAWFGTQYWIGGAGLAGKRISTQPNRVKPGIRWIFNGSMPGTLALLAQMTTQKARVGAVCIIIPTRMANSDAFLDQLNSGPGFHGCQVSSPCAGRTCSGPGTNCKTQGLRTGGIVVQPAEYRPYLTTCSWLNRPYNAETMSTISPVKCTDPANPADAEWYLFMYNSGQANWASVGLTEEVYNTAKFDASCSGEDCYVLGCARESCCFALCADTVAKGGQCVWKDFDIGGGVMRRWYDIQPLNQPSTACDPRGGGGKGTGSGRGSGRGHDRRRHLLGQQPTFATTDNSVGPLEPVHHAHHRRSLQQDVAVVPDRYLCDPQTDPSPCYRFSYEWSIAENGTLTIVNIDCPCCPQDNALAVQLVAQML